MEYNQSCLFCKIIKGEEPCQRILETDFAVVIKNKYPNAPIHLLVLDKEHNEKPQNLIRAIRAGYWDDMFNAVHKAILQLGLDKTGYKIEINGAGYNHFEHEHIHILGGKEFKA